MTGTNNAKNFDNSSASPYIDFTSHTRITLSV